MQMSWKYQEIQKLEAEPEDVTELLQFYDKTVMGKELLLMDEQRKWLPEIEFISRNLSSIYLHLLVKMQ